MACQSEVPTAHKVPERWSHEKWERFIAGIGFWEVSVGVFAPCASELHGDELGPKHPWHNVLLSYEYDLFSDPVSRSIAGRTSDFAMNPPVIPPPYTLSRADSDFLDIGYAIRGLFFAWKGVPVDPSALAPDAPAQLRPIDVKERVEENGSFRRFEIWTPPHEVELWYSLHTPERTKAFEEAWQEWNDPELMDSPTMLPPPSMGLELAVAYPNTRAFDIGTKETD